MTNSQNFRDNNQIIHHLKDVPYFHAKIGSSLTPEGRRLLEEYSRIHPDEVLAHIYKIVSTLYPSICSKPCLLVFREPGALAQHLCTSPYSLQSIKRRLTEGNLFPTA